MLLLDSVGSLICLIAETVFVAAKLMVCGLDGFDEFGFEGLPPNSRAGFLDASFDMAA